MPRLTIKQERDRGGRPPDTDILFVRIFFRGMLAAKPEGPFERRKGGAALEEIATF